MMTTMFTGPRRPDRAVISSEASPRPHREANATRACLDTASDVDAAGAESTTTLEHSEMS